MAILRATTAVAIIAFAHGKSVALFFTWIVVYRLSYGGLAGGGSLKRNTLRRFEPIVFVFPGRRQVICTAHEAAAALIRDWPPHEGDEFCEAIKICWEVIVGRAEPAKLRRAMMRAAEEAGIATISIVR